MYTLRFLLLFIFIFSCNTEPIRKEIIVGKTIKIMPSNFGTGNLSTNYNFLWSKPLCISPPFPYNFEFFSR